MLLLIHISVALSSLLLSSVAILRPSGRILNISYSLVGATLLSGTGLALSRPAHILSICLTGLLYIGTASICLLLARQRLAKLTNR